MRGTEDAADPKTTLAMEAAVRRRSARRTDDRTSERFRLSAVPRVVRAPKNGKPLLRNGAAGNDPLDLLSGHGSDSIEVGVVVKDEYVVAFCDCGDQ